MSILTDDLPKTATLATVISVILHGAAIVGLLFAAATPHIPKPAAEKAINVELIAPQVQPNPSRVTTQPTVAKLEMEQASTPKIEAPQVKAAVTMPKLIDHKTIKQKPKRVERPKAKIQPVETKQPLKKKVSENNPFSKNDNAQPEKSAQTAPEKSIHQDKSIAKGPPQRVNTVEPGYPTRALALQIEGQVKAQFDIDTEGKVNNIRILTAQPRNMFDHEVKQALKRWRYQAGRPTLGQIITIQFRIDGTSVIH